MAADETDGQADESPGGTAPTEPLNTVTAPASGSTAEAAPARISRRRLIGVDVLIGVTTLLLVVGIFATWANRLLFSPDNWSKTSTQLLQDANVRSTTANYLVDQLYANVNVTGLIKQGLPTQLQGLAAPAAGALRNAAVQGAELALSRPRVQQLWAQANRAADQTFIDIVNGRKGASGQQGVVSLDLASILNNVALASGCRRASPQSSRRASRTWSSSSPTSSSTSRTGARRSRAWRCGCRSSCRCCTCWRCSWRRVIGGER